MLCFSKVCYTCLSSENKQLVDVNKEDSDNISYIKKIRICMNSDLVSSCFVHKFCVYFCLYFIIALQEELNSMEICKQCIKNLRIAYKFRETVSYSQATLKKYTAHNSIKNDLDIIKLENNEDTSNTIRDDIIEDILIDAKKEDIKNEMNVYDSDSNDCFLADLKKDLKNDHPEVILKTSDDPAEDSATNQIERPTKKKTRIRKEKQSFSCAPCALEFDKKWKLCKHVSQVHVNEEKKYICTFCNRAFKQSYHLREHITSHTGERNYSCTICGKTFQRQSSQKRHIKSHDAAPGQKTKRTPFLCTICGKSFPFSNGVQRHMRIHLGIRRHECAICHKKFMQSTHLHVHMRTHTGEKPYICDTCGEAFSLNASLQKHMAVHKNKKESTKYFGMYLEEGS